MKIQIKDLLKKNKLYSIQYIYVTFNSSLELNSTFHPGSALYAHVVRQVISCAVQCTPWRQVSA